MDTSNREEPKDILTSDEEFSMAGYDKHIRNTRIMLFIIAGLQLLPLLTLGSLPDETKMLVAIVSLITAAVFVGLGIWTKYKPYTAIIVALCVYLGIIALTAIAAGMATIFQGIIVKSIVVVLFILGLRNAKEIEEARRNHGL